MTLCFGVARAQDSLTVHMPHDQLPYANNGYVPLYGYYADAYLKCEMVYPADELNAMAGSTITGMTFYASAIPYRCWNAVFKVFVAEVNFTTIHTYVGPDCGTIVYRGGLEVNTIDHTMRVEFDTPYTYNGNNLLVGVYLTTPGTYSNVIWIGESMEGASIQGYHYAGLGSVPITQRNFLPMTTFTYGTGASNVFTTEGGEWNVAANWQSGEVPEAGSHVTIAANVVVPAGYVADAGSITIENGATITVAEGGQLKTTSDGVNATMLKSITGFGSSEGGWVILANPTKDDQNPGTLGMTTGIYDLYYFNLNCDGTYDEEGNVQTPGTDGSEWRNYKASAFDLVNGQGYLYANSTDKDLAFTGEIYPTNTDISVLMHYSADAEYPGMNLVGNPYSCDAYLADGRDFYVLDPEGIEFIIATNPAIAPTRGVLVEATEVGNLTFTTTAPGSKSALNINVTRQNALVDRAVVNFGEGKSLKKYQLNENHSKVYMPMDGSDYAVVYTEKQGEMPICFKAENYGTYTLSFNTENVEFGYLHLIDNMTGDDIDLLSTHSYSFEANTTDYANRFRLVFVKSTNEDNFAFYDNGSFVISNQGNATVQVIDINGRILSSKTINGCADLNLNLTSGVYMLRLINSEDVKVQKVVVK